ncbi:hypothetical protein AMYX_25120 [Anaeromyxobacter diazotrophicus]|uniref:Carrier domain-containing protein n=1 Tax=Anaeromyxobacter diazotrophicus TaxID=2590199 RepID=A0A7I9VN12_9BACT|nr:non-ribosomal peptide synthetase [Anaeromyxobacter diazotrophicus]GEJ57771.1 hypothetical protein AMYX_25120 [Anaeromyxobacter diazotrophicus]
MNHEVEDLYPLSPMQQGMLFHTLRDPGSGVYVEQLAFELEGALDADAFARAWQLVLARHPILRTGFVWEGVDEPLQLVHRGVELPLEREDWRGLGAEAQAARLEERFRQERARGFDLAVPPLLRLGLARTGDAVHLFTFSHHHLLLDGWSVPLVLKDVLAAYEALRRGEAPRLPPVRPYRDFIAWLQRRDPARSEDFWRRALAGVRQPTPLGIDHPAAAAAEDAPPALQHELVLGPAELASILALARRLHLTPSTVVLGAWALLLSRYSGEEDVVFGATVSGRPADLPGAESTVGLFINTLPVRVRVDPDATAAVWLEAVQAQQVELRQHEHTPLVRVRQWSEVPSPQPLFESLFVFENYPVDASLRESGGPLRVRCAGSASRVSFPLVISAAAGTELTLTASADPARLDAGAVEGALAHLREVLLAMAARPETRLARLPLVGTEERRRLLAAGAGARGGEPALDFPSTVARRAAVAPDAPALVAGDVRWSYAELERRACQVAHRLRAAGAAPGARVAHLLPRNADALAALLGIWKVGAIYVPLDPQSPPARSAGILAAAGARLVLTHRGAAAALSAPHVTPVFLDGLDDEPLVAAAAPLAPETLAYVIYTSGSTGAPKGVAVTHGALARHDRALRDRYGLGAEDRVLEFFSFAFDASLEQLLLAWGAGGTLVLRGDELWEPRRFAEELARHRLTVATVAPAYLDTVVRAWEASGERGGWPEPQVRRLLVGGEPLRPDTVVRLRRTPLGRAQLVNVYGPTEATISCASCDVPSDLGPILARGRVPIGRPLQGCRAYVLDPGGELAPAGVPGELYVGGDALAAGYLDRPELTAERFLPDPFHPRERVYRTGDRVRWTPDGELEFLGRADEQVKVRGFRVEPAEIEAALATHPAVAAAAVAARADATGELRLVGYVVAQAGATAGAAELRRYLLERLPDYMVPSAFVALDALPRTAGDKIDRRRLPAPAVEAAAAGRDAPRTPAEEVLCGLFAHVLGVERVGLDDDFFALGGHSLRATQLAARIRDAFDVDLPLKAIFEAPTVAALMARVARGRPATASAPPVSRQPEGEPRRASFAQQRLWFLDRLAPGSTRYNVPVAARLDGPLDVAALGRALAELVRRHEVLRTCFAEADGSPSPIVLEAGPVPLPLEDLSSLPAGEREAAARRRATDEAQRPFDLARGPVFRAHLFRLDPLAHLLLVTVHHVASDGWSAGVMTRELGELYRAFAAGRPSPLPELPLQYADYARWQRAWLTGEALEAQLGYWRERLAGAPALLALPTDRPRPPVASDRGGHVRFQVPTALAQAVLRVGRAEGATPFMTLLAAFQVLLGKLAGQEDVCVGTPIANRTRAELEGLVGFFVNTLVLRGDLSGDPSFRDLLVRTRDAALAAYAHQDVPFEMVVEALQPRRALSHSPLFQAMFALDDTPRAPLSLDGLTLTPAQPEGGAAAFDLTLSLAGGADGLEGDLEYNADLFDDETARRMLRQLQTLLAAIAAAPDRRLSSLPCMDEAERHRLVRTWSRNDAPAPLDPSFAARCEGWARRSPGACAVSFGGEALTYRELNARASALSRRLRTHGVRRGVRVGICAERSTEMVVAVLAVMKAGGAYVPLDPTYPAQRLAFMLEDAGLGLLLAQPHLRARLGSTTVQAMALDGSAMAGGEPTADEDGPGPEDVAYAIYTSGSTGRPKAALLKHRGLVNLSEAQRVAFGLGPGSRVLQFSPFSFDASVWELAMALGNGATLCLAPQEVLGSATELTALMKEQRITHVTLPPSVLAVLAPEELPELATVISAGEACTRELVERWAPGRRMWNAYGPTETTVCATMGPCSAEDARPPSIGKPIANARAYVLDARQRPVPVGVPGELCIGGVGVAQGYLHRPELTAERFLPDPFEPGGRIYRTGDLARWRADGTIEFLGRIDQQVKVRGFRIEPAEVEAALRRHPAVRECLVLAREDRPGDARLVAYVGHGEGAAPSAAELKAAVRAELPEHMLPTAYVCLAKLPLSPSGKVDRAALPAPEARSERAYVAPRTEVEEKLAGLCAGLLNVERVGVEDDFFELGGHSLLATQLLSRVREAFQVELPLRTLFERPTVADLASAVEQARAGAPAAEAPAIVAVPRGDHRRKRSAVVAEPRPEQAAAGAQGGGEP